MYEVAYTKDGVEIVVGGIEVIYATGLKVVIPWDKASAVSAQMARCVIVHDAVDEVKQAFATGGIITDPGLYNIGEGR